jgi:hypothetical protein
MTRLRLDGRGDLSAAKRALDSLDADHGNDPGVMEWRAFDRQAQEQAAQRERPRDAS